MHPDLIAIQRGEFCKKHKILLSDDGSCKHCLSSIPKWKPDNIVPEIAYRWLFRGWLLLVGILGYFWLYSLMGK